jgi:hypothetical protein
MDGRPPFFPRKQSNKPQKLIIKTDNERMTEQAKIDAAINKPFTPEDLELFAQQELEHKEGVAEGRLSPAMEIKSNLFLEQSRARLEQPRKQFKHIKKILNLTSDNPIKIYLLEEYIGTYKYKGENRQLKSEIFECIKDCTGGVGIGQPLELSEKELDTYTFEIINNPLRLGGKFKRRKTKTKGKRKPIRKSKKYKKRSKKYK